MCTGVEIPMEREGWERKTLMLFLVLVLKDSLRTKFKYLSLSWSL